MKMGYEELTHLAELEARPQTALSAEYKRRVARSDIDIDFPRELTCR